MSDPITRGREAKYLINHPLLNECLVKIEKEAVDGIKTCSADRLLEYRARLDGIEFFKSALHGHLSDAMIAEHTE